MRLKLPEVNTAIILAGGKGKRMIDFSKICDILSNQGFSPQKMHKSMIPIRGKPLLEYIILWLRKWRIKNIIIGVGYLKESIMTYFENGRRWGVNIRYVSHDPEGGTADALKEDLEKSGIDNEYFFVTNADQLTTFPLKKMIEVHFSGESIPLATIGLVQPILPFGEVKFNPKNYEILSFKEKPLLKIPINAGFYLFSREIKPYLKGDLERNVFPALVRQGKIKGYFYKGFWETINTIKDWERINNSKSCQMIIKKFFS